MRYSASLLRVWFFGVVLILAAWAESASAEGGGILRPIENTKRPVDLMSPHRVAEVRSKLPPIADPVLKDVLNSIDTIWYDRNSIIPGYQDSFGDNIQTPIGFRPNTIERIMIDLAVPGGHSQLFIRHGEFHFPFGRTGLAGDATNTFVVNFWRLPRQANRFLPVVWWKWNPNHITHRTEWMFPEGTVFGEIIFITDSKRVAHVFEIRTRTRHLDGWTSDIFRPFPTAQSFADALESKRRERPEWQTSTSIDRLIQHTKNPNTLVARELKPVRFHPAFEPIRGAVDELPPVEDERILVELLHETPLQSAKHLEWKRNGNLVAFAASTQSAFSIVPKNYNAAFFEVSDAFCNRCHQDAGRPFKDYYRQIMAYGELWGEDDTVTWHPFDEKFFVDANGKVRNFNHDNRRFRQDFINAGLLAQYSSTVHGSDKYRKIERPWKNYRY